MMRPIPWSYGDYEAIGLEYFLPKIQWPGLSPPLPDTNTVKRPSSIKTQTSAAGSIADPQEMKGLENQSITELEISTDRPLRVCSEASKVQIENHAPLFSEFCTIHCLGGNTLCENYTEIEEILAEACPIFF